MMSVKIMKVNHGLTLLELIAALLCFTILVLITAASWRHYASKIHQSLTIYRISSGLAYARNQALLRQHPIMYCGSSNSVDCDGNWQHAQLVKDKQTGKILKAYSFAKQHMKIDFRASFGAVKAVEFTSQGFTDGQQGHFSVCTSPSMSSIKHCKWLVLHFSGETVVLNPAA